MTALPTRKAEGWRYADLAALATAWPLAPAETIAVPAETQQSRTLISAAGGDGVRVHRFAIDIAAGAGFAMFVVAAEGRYARIELDVTLHEAARFNFGGVILAGGEQVIEIVTTLHHVGAGATSRQTVRAIAGGTATASFLGKVAVARSGQQTDAAQSFKALLLERGATANARPELEIFADDVKCGHGATVGELDTDALFYLESRGVPPAEARSLLIRAFAADALAALPEAERDAAAERLEALL